MGDHYCADGMAVVTASADHPPWPQPETLASLPEHGGDVDAAAALYGLAAEQWLDLSTGINPAPYPVPVLPASVFTALPYPQRDFLAAAAAYYRQNRLLAVAGTQSAIQLLPALVNQAKVIDVLVPAVGYQEHAKQWQANGNTLAHYCSESLAAMAADIDERLARNAQQHLVVIRPNNPTAVMVGTAQLLRWSEQLLAPGCLIVDEAFIDVEAEHSLLAQASLPDNIIVLRSFGKFFGLAGIRLGFVFANAALLAGLAEKMGPWQVNGPAQYIAAKALRDGAWQLQARQRIADNAQHTAVLVGPLQAHFKLPQPLTSHLFLSYPMPLPSALALYHFFARAAVLTRVVAMDEQRALWRIGCIDRSDAAAVARVQQLVSRLCQFDSVDSLQAAVTQG